MAVVSAGSCSSDSIPSLGTSIHHLGAALKKLKNTKDSEGSRTQREGRGEEKMLRCGSTRGHRECPRAVELGLRPGEVNGPDLWETPPYSGAREVGRGFRDWVGGALGAEVGGGCRSGCYGPAGHLTTRECAPGSSGWL